MAGGQGGWALHHGAGAGALSETVNWQKDRATPFYRLAALLAVLVAVTGFFFTYIQPMAQGRFTGPSWSHVHGSLLAGWLALMVAQTSLVGMNLRLHRRLGWTALALAPAITASTFAIAIEAAHRDVAAGGGVDSVSAVLGSLTATTIFLLLVLAAIALRRKPQWHKRIMFIATVAILWPAWFRWRHFLPGVPRPDVSLGLILADLPILIAMARDRLRFGAVHPAYRWLGLGLIAEQSLEFLAFDTPAWHALAQTLFAVLS